MDNNIKKIISQIVRETLINEFWGRKENDVFAELKNLDKRNAEFREYVKLLSNFPKAGEGSTRMVFAVDKDLVIKLEKPYGEPQNEFEADPSLRSLFGNFVPKVFDHGANYLWIVSERVTPVATREQEKEWLRKAGLGDIADRNLEMFNISNFLEDFHTIYEEIEQEVGTEALDQVNAERVFAAAKKSAMRGTDKSSGADWNFTLDDLKKWAENPIIGLISRARRDNDVAVGDIGLGNIGFGADGRPVILDVGLAKASFDNDW